MSSGKYRLRTVAREILPERVAALIPKGGRDCGNHEWYRASEHEWHCYHCTVGVTRESPWDERELQARELEAEAMGVRAGVASAHRVPVHH